jgi:hypothetical protein
MPKDKDERRNERRAGRRTDRRARVKKKLAGNGTVQRLREARREIKELRARLAKYENTKDALMVMPAPDKSPELPPIGAVTPVTPE